MPQAREKTDRRDAAVTAGQRMANQPGELTLVEGTEYSALRQQARTVTLIGEPIRWDEV